MNNKTNQYQALLAINAGILISYLIASPVIAAECGQAKLIEAGSVGVNVTKNTCQESSRLEVGSILELSSGSRMWLKFDPNAKGEVFQLICQNKSAGIVDVNFTGAAMPWIKPQNLKNCDSWKANKFSCESQDGEKNSFFCAVAGTKLDNLNTTPERTTSLKMASTTTPEITTSVKMRSLFPAAIPVDDIIKNIKPDIELCKSLYQVSGKLEMSWTVSLGIIKDLSVNSENKDLVACVEGVAKQANANQNITIKYAF